MHIISRNSLGLLAFALSSTKALAVDVNAGDYTALPAGTNVAAAIVLWSLPGAGNPGAD